MISLCAITKNEAHCLATMLDSVRGLVGEIIIVDTGSTDATRDIARSYGAHVAELVWQNDFAAARNASIALARFPWILVLDADEALDEGSIAPIKTWTAGAPRGIWLERRHYLGAPAPNEGRPLSPTDPLRACGVHSFISTSDLRLFPNIPAARYEGAVHESIEEPLDRSGIAMLRSDAIVHHFGHLASTERKLEKTIHYVQLAQQKAALAPSDWRAHFQLGVELQNLGAIAESVPSLESSLRLNDAYAPTWRQLAIAHLVLGDDAKALATVGEALSRDSSDVTAWQIMGLCFERTGNLAEAELCFRTILNAIPDHPAALARLSQIAK